ncbi:MAG: c-type cytochrome, partial [Planctomycetes bacterium]|nr:c-type cytochrome [Planctomycetota bacterium]
MRRSRRLQFAWLVALPLALVPCAIAADEDWEDEEYVELPLGLEAIYQTADGNGVIHRMEPAPRLYGGDLDAPHPKLPADFRVAWRGRLLVPYDAQYTFSLVGSSLSELSLTLRGRSVGLGEPVELEFGNVPFALSAVHRGGPPRLELAWETEFFDREVIAARFFGHESAAAGSPEIARQVLEDSGAALAESFGCFRCHRGPEAWVKSLTANLKPAVFLPGPQLRGVGQRAHRSWLKDYLTDPAAYRPGTRMPAQLAADGSDRTALETIVAYLTSGQTSVWAGARPSGSGEKVYEACGCAACHEPPEGAVAAAGVPLRIPSLDRLAEKWTAPGLVSFLEAPLATRPHGRMPDFALAETEGRDLATYLLGREGAGEVREFVALPTPKEPVTSDARNLVDPKGQMLVMGLDEGSGKLADRSGQENHGRVVGSLTYGQEGQSGRALGFDGQGGHVIVGDTSSFNMNKAFTWSAWIKTTGSGSILARAPETGNWVWGGKTLFVRDGKLAFDIGWIGVVTSKTEVADDRWHHVAVTAEFQTDRGFDTVILYVDGRQDAAGYELDVNRYPEENFVFKLGMASVNFPQEETFDGLVDDVAVWSRTLDPEEIAALAGGKSHLALTEASLYAPGELKTQWTGLGEHPAEFDRLPAGLRLKTVALRQMGRYGCLGCHDIGAQSLLKIRRRPHGAPQLTMTSRPPIARPFARLSGEPSERGCLGDAPGRGAAPRFDFSDDERSALAAYVASLARRTTDSLAESAAVDLKLLNCTA